MKTFIFTLFLSVTLALSACGFKLRSKAMLPKQLHRIYLSSNADYSQAVPRLKSLLRAAGLAIVNRKEQALYHLKILSEHFTVSQSSTSSASQLVSGIVRFFMRYEITGKDGKVLFGPISATSYETIFTNANQLQSTKSAEADIKNSVLQQTLNQVLNQLTSSKARQNFAQ